jgi:DNA-binding SARP family transcriptional activator
MGSLEVRTLGSIEVRRAPGGWEPVGGAGLSALLALLALRAPHTVSRDLLIDELWGEKQPGNPENALHARISQLRRVVGPDTVVHRPQGYTLAVEAEDIDAVRVESLVRAGREAVAAGDVAASGAPFEEALALMPDEPFHDLLDHRFARVAAARVGELALAAHEGLADARLATGRHSEAVGPLAELVALHPLRERFHAQLVLALYRSGRQADALGAYQTARTVLLEELGLEPGAELQALERAVLVHDPSLDHAAALPQRSVLPGARDLVSWRATTGSEAAAPTRLPLSGRRAELDAMQPIVAAAVGGVGGVVLVEGEPGVGKTRLVEELAGGARAAGATVVWGRCYEGQGAPTFWPWVQVVEALLEQSEPAVLRAALDGSAAELAQIVPEVKEHVGPLDPAPPLDPEGTRFRLSQAVCRLLTRLAANRPVAVVLDDLQWADRSSMQLLAFLAGALDRSALVVLATYRDADPVVGADLSETLAALSRHGSTHRVALGGLDVDGLEQYLVSAGVEPNADVLATLHQRTRGNPFFLGEIARMFPLVSDPSDARAMGRAIPSNVKDLVRRRVGRLPVETTQALSAASTLGHDFDLGLLATMVGVDRGAVLDRLEPALQAGLLINSPEGPGRFRCSHGLVHEVLYDDLGVAQRARLHLRAAEAISARHGDTAGSHLIAVADHWFKAVPAADPAQAVAAAIEASHWGLAHVAHQQAEALLEAAVALLVSMPASEDRARMEMEVQNELCLLYIVTTSYAGAGLAVASARIRDLCDELDDAELLVQAMWRLAVTYMMRGDLDLGIGVGENLLARAAAEASPVMELAGSMSLGIILTQRGDLRAARAHLDRAVLLCDEGHDAALARGVAEEPAVFARVFSAINHGLLGDATKADQHVSEALAVAAAGGPHAYGNFLALWGGLTVAVVLYRLEATIAFCDDARAIASREGFAMGGRYGYAGAPADWARGVRGEAGAAAEVRTSIDGLRSVGVTYMIHQLYAMHADACLAVGEVEDARASIDAGLALVAETGEAWYAAELHRLDAVARAAVDPSDPRALAAVDEALRVAVSQGARELARRAIATREALLST